MTKEPSPRITGRFDMETAICNLFHLDAHPLSQLGLQKKLNPETTYRNIAAHAHQLSDSFPIGWFAAELPPQIRATLFHERVHYWQLLSCPLQQTMFIDFLHRLGTGVEKMGGNSNLVCWAPSLPHDTQYAKETSRVQFRNDIEDSIIRTLNEVSAAPYAAMPYCEIPFGRDGVYPEYGAILGFEKEGAAEKLLFPLNGRYLMESAAYISEMLYMNQPLPNTTWIDNKESLPYLGAWEFWRRLHGKRYKSTQALAFAFLAAVDLAITSDVVDVEELDGEYMAEMMSISYRFGKLAYRILGIPPFNLHEEEEPAAAVVRFQKEICQWNGWLAPNRFFKKMAIFLTKFLLESEAKRLPKFNDPPMMTILDSLFTKRIVAEKYETIKSLWGLIANLSELAPSVGQHIIGTMLNSLVYRLENPGEFILPHIYHNKLQSYFPLPAILYEGRYYWDTDNEGFTGKTLNPYVVAPTELIQDVISLVTTHPIKNGNMECGFISQNMNCWYITEGIGCPQDIVSEDQVKLRLNVGLGDWCHLKLRHMFLKL